MIRARHLVGVVALVLLVLTSCGNLVVGDSLVVQAATAAGGVPTAYGTSEQTSDGVTLRGFSGGAPCDYLGLMSGDFDKHQPKRVSLAFSGNTGTPCMQDLAGKPLTGSALVLKYRADLATITRFFAAKGVGVIYSAPLCVGPHVTGRMNGSPALRAMEQRLAADLAAQRFHVAYSQFAALQICPSWRYVSAYRTADEIHLSSIGASVYAKALRHESKRTRIP